MAVKKKPFQYYLLLLVLFLIIIGLVLYIIYLHFKTKTTVTVPTVLPTADVTVLPKIPDPVQVRDRQVLDNPLYPPTSREGADNTRAMMNEPRLQPSRITDSMDSYRLSGYLVSQEDRNDTWKLFAREKYPRRGDADFYAQPANRNMELKVALTPDVVSPRMRDLYSMPDEVSVNHPMFSPSKYNVVQLPPTNLGTGYW